MINPEKIGAILKKTYYMTQIPCVGNDDEIYLLPEEVHKCMATDDWPVSQGSKETIHVDKSLFNEGV
jgi:hypothetical protein